MGLTLVRRASLYVVGVDGLVIGLILGSLAGIRLESYIRYKCVGFTIFARGTLQAIAMVLGQSQNI